MHFPSQLFREKVRVFHEMEPALCGDDEEVDVTEIIVRARGEAAIDADHRMFREFSVASALEKAAYVDECLQLLVEGMLPVRSHHEEILPSLRGNKAIAAEECHRLMGLCRGAIDALGDSPDGKLFPSNGVDNAQVCCAQQPSKVHDMKILFIINKHFVRKE